MAHTRILLKPHLWLAGWVLAEVFSTVEVKAREQQTCSWGLSFPRLVPTHVSPESGLISALKFLPGMGARGRISVGTSTLFFPFVDLVRTLVIPKWGFP